MVKQVDKYVVFEVLKMVTMMAGFEVLTAVVMKSTIFWDIMRYSPLRANTCFRGTYRLHLQDRKIS
jgi:hypothetical protein